MSITTIRLENITVYIQALALTLGLIEEGDELQLDIGSKHYGNAFRLWLVKPVGFEKGSRWQTPPFGEYLGMTKKEADLSLCGIKDSLNAVLRLPKN